ncbi:uncharacterized protein LOC128871763 [Anastrepha ludens]|uniref:uncharacterized protein LOC128871763 n=1 Tax=Anastrepha ludens TaxID=28586 RepID=UPI0023B1A4A2|nr:uncharacterized protein LOC128871763 [Anastrepha ludens]
MTGKCSFSRGTRLAKTISPLTDFSTKINRKGLNYVNLAARHDDDPTYSCTMPKKQRSCCVVGCVVEKGHALYAFPRRGEARNSWALACNVQPADTDRLYVCFFIYIFYRYFPFQVFSIF